MTEERGWIKSAQDANSSRAPELWAGWRTYNVLSVNTASAEQPFSRLKLIKTIEMLNLQIC